MSRRSNELLEKVLENIRYHTTRRVVTSPEGTPPEKQQTALAIDLLLHRARYFVTVAGSASAKADGWSATTPGNGNPGSGKGGGRMMGIVDEAGDMDYVRTSSTEIAAIDARRQRDEMSEIGQSVNRRLHTIANAFEGMARDLDRAERLQSTATIEDPPMCWLAQVRYKLPFDIAWEPFKTTDFAGVIEEPFDEPRKVSSFVYWYTRNHKQLPEKATMLEYLAKGVARVRA